MIFNTLSITVAQRTREFATLRTLGASRKQVLRSVRLEGLVDRPARLGDRARASASGSPRACSRCSARSASTCPTAARCSRCARSSSRCSWAPASRCSRRSCPARRATRVPPIAAVREGATLPAVAVRRALAQDRRSRVARLGRRDLGSASSRGLSGGADRRCCSASACSGCSSASRCSPRGSSKPLARVVGWPARRAGGVAGELAGANARPQPGPHGLDRRRADDRAHARHRRGRARRRHEQRRRRRRSTDQVRADYVVDGNDGLPFSAERGRRAGARDRRRGRSHVRRDTALVEGEETDVTGIDPATIGRFYRFEWTQGSDATLAQLGRDGALVTAELRRRPRPRGRRQARDPVALGRRSARSSCAASTTRRRRSRCWTSVSITQATFDGAFPSPKNAFTFLDADAARRHGARGRR